MFKYLLFPSPPLGKEGKARITVERVGTGVLDRPKKHHNPRADDICPYRLK